MRAVADGARHHRCGLAPYERPLHERADEELAEVVDWLESHFTPEQGRKFLVQLNGEHRHQTDAGWQLRDQLVQHARSISLAALVPWDEEEVDPRRVTFHVPRKKGSFAEVHGFQAEPPPTTADKPSPGPMTGRAPPLFRFFGQPAAVGRSLARRTAKKGQARSAKTNIVKEMTPPCKRVVT